MPRADITSEYRSDAGKATFPKLKLQTNEYARIVVVGKPVVEFLHWLEAPNIVNMAPTYKKIKDREGQDQYVVDTRLVSRPICFGEFETLRERGVDEKGCQACLQARERPDIFRPPSPRYAVPILRYGLRPGGGWNDIAAPYGVNALVWVFGGKVMDKLIDIRSMGPAYEDIRMVDLLLTCDEQTYQKPYSNGEFLPVAPAFWMVNDQTRQYTVQYLQHNGATEEQLFDAIGKRVKPDWLADDLNRVIQRWEVVRAYESRQQGAPHLGPGFGTETFAQGMGNLQQQYGQPPGYGQVPQGPQGYAGQPAASAGVDMSLMGGHQFPGQQQAYAMATGQQPALPPSPPPMPSVPAAPASFSMPSVPAPPADQNAGQWQPPGQLGDMFQAPLSPTTPAAGSIPPVQSAAASDLASATPAQQAPVQGLAGLEEFMAGKTSNPPVGPAPALPTDLLGPAAAVPVATPGTAEPPPAGGSYSFEQLAEMGGK